MSYGKSCLRCLSISLLVSNSIFLILGDVLIGAGIYFFLFDNQKLIQELNQVLSNEFKAFRLALIISGSLMVATAFCACAGVVLKSRGALILYTCLTCLAILACSAAAVVTAVVPSLSQSLQIKLDREFKPSYGNSSLVTWAVNSMQTEFECCGWKINSEKNDDSQAENSCVWFDNTAWRHGSIFPGSSDVTPLCPPSCCPARITPCNSTSQQSCNKAVVDKFMILIPLAAVVAVLVSLCHLMCSLMLLVKGIGNNPISAI